MPRPPRRPQSPSPGASFPYPPVKLICCAAATWRRHAPSQPPRRSHSCMSSRRPCCRRQPQRGFKPMAPNLCPGVNLGSPWGVRPLL
jgi:hypothetical protein